MISRTRSQHLNKKDGRKHALCHLVETASEVSLGIGGLGFIGIGGVGWLRDV